MRGLELNPAPFCAKLSKQISRNRKEPVMAVTGDNPITSDLGEEMKGRGSFGIRVRDIGNRVTVLEARMTVIEEVLKKIQEAVDPKTIDWLWDNFEEMRDVVSATRRHVGLPSLSEFSGSKERRRMKEATG